MAAKRTRDQGRQDRAAGQHGERGDGGFSVVLEDVRGHFAVLGEALHGLREHMDRRFESVERQLGLLTDAVRTHSK